MKHLLTFLLGALLLARAADAQTVGPVRQSVTPAPDPVRQKLDLIFANLDKN